MKRSLYLHLIAGLVASAAGQAVASPEHLKNALMPIDPSTAQYAQPDNPPPVTNPPVGWNQPLGRVQGSPVSGSPKRTLNDPNPSNSDYDQNDGVGYGAAIDEQRVVRLEQMVFGSNYPEHELDDRIDHLDVEVFGSKKNDQPAPQRLAALEAKLGGSAFGAATDNNVRFSPSMPLSPNRPPARPGYNPNMQMQMPVQNQGYNPNMQTQMPVQNQGYNPNMQTQMPAQNQGYNPNMQAQVPVQNQGYNPNMQTQMPVQNQGYNPNMQIQVPVQNQGYNPNMQTQMPVQNQGYNPNMQTQMPVQNQGYNPNMQTQMPPAAPAFKPGLQKANSAAGLPPEEATKTAKSLTQSVPFHKEAGDYFSSISKFSSNSVARWTSLPVRIHLPEGAPEGSIKLLESSVNKWNQYLPLRITPPSELADIEVAWINHLPPKQLGLTNLEVFNGRMRVTVYLLRPTYYLPSTPERALARVALHEIGHAIGLFGHSTVSEDIMYPLESFGGKETGSTKSGGISARDLNTLRRVYESPALPSGFQTPHPMGWTFQK